MNCGKVGRRLLERAGEPLDAECAAHIGTCPECRRAHARAQSLRNLLSLKRLEQPDPAFETRCHDATMRRVRALAEEPSGSPVWAWFALPSVRYSLAAAVAALVGFNVLWGVREPGVDPASGVAEMAPAEAAIVEAAAPEPEQGAEAAILADAAPAYVAPSQDVHLIAASNRQWDGRGLQYGSGPSVPVGFNF